MLLLDGTASAVNIQSNVRRAGKTAFIDPVVVQPSDLNRRIWLFWKQGLDQAPYTVQKAILSWKKYNPTWSIVVLSDENLAYYIDPKRTKEWETWAISLPGFADLVRMHLLSTYGGVWADATMVCMEPLDAWVWNTTAVSGPGVWGYNARGFTALAPFFLVASVKSYIIQAWYQHALECAANPNKTREYFWIDYAFLDLHADPEFERHFNMVQPSIGMSGCYGAHKGLPDDPLEKEGSVCTKECLEHTHAVKLKWHGDHAVSSEGNPYDSCGHYVIYRSLGSM